MLLYTLLISHLVLLATASKPPPTQQGASQGQKQSKAGIAWPAQEKTSDPLVKFFGPESKLSWHWNWGMNYNQGALPDTTPGLTINAEYVPAFFGLGDVDKPDQLQAGYKTLMGFNEPDLQLAGVAVLEDAKTAAQSQVPFTSRRLKVPILTRFSWVKIAALRKADPNVKLISPGVAGNLNWMVDFMSNLTELEKDPGTGYNLQPDYINVHAYATSFGGLQGKVEQFHNAFSSLPVYITEFAMHSFDDTPPPKDQQAVHDFMGQTTKWMDETDWIFRYAWFGAVKHAENLHEVHPYNRLMDDQGELTNLGWQYVHGGHK